MKTRSNSHEEIDSFYSPELSQIVVTRRCNLSCSYCNEFNHLSEPVAKIKVMQRIKKLRNIGTGVIEFTGGEPLLHPDISGFVAYAKSLGFIYVCLKTNGILLSEALVNSLNEAQLNALQLSVDTVSKNEVTTKSIEGLGCRFELLSKYARFRVIVSIVIGGTSLKETVEVVNTIQEMGFVPRILLRHGDDGQMNLSKAECKTYKILIERFPNLFSEADGYRKQLLMGEELPFKCRAGCKYLYIDESGMVRWCSQQRNKFGKSLLDYTFSDLIAQFHTVKPCSPKCTLGCVRTISYKYKSY